MSTIKQKNTDNAKQTIINLFYENVRGKTPDISKFNKKHAGKSGHWLERQMGVKANASNTPDLYDFEMKNNTSTKTTFGDWSADYYIYRDANYNISRDDFLKIFGKSNIDKKGRFSWSGEPCPKIGPFNSYGQKLYVNEKNDIIAEYSFTADKRINKTKIVPVIMQKDKLMLAKWDANSMKKKLENKFNKQGWFKCLTNKKGIYINIVFGEPINFATWIENVKNGSVIFDSGMHQGNPRPYSEWRSNNRFWENLITSKY